MMPNFRTQSLNAERISLRVSVGVVLMLLCVTCFGQSVAEPPAPAPDTEAPVRTDIVRSIEFQGNEEFKDKILGQRIGVELGDQSDPFLVEGARRTIVDLYKKKGYVFAQVAVDRDMAEKGQLFFTITEGTRVRVKAVRILGNTAISTRNIKKVIKTKTRRMFALAAFYSEQNVAEDVERLREFYYDRGYLGYAVETATEFIDNNKAAMVTFSIDEGEPYHIAEIEFMGNTFFDRETLGKSLTLSTGQVYRKSRAVVDKRALMALYLEKGFVDVQIYQEPRYGGDLDDHTVVLSYEIREGRQFRIGRIDITGNLGVQDKVARNVLNEYDVIPGKLYNAKIAPDEGQKSLMEKYVQRSTLAEEIIIQPVPVAGNADVKDMRVDIKEGMTGMIMPGVGISSDSGVMGQLIYQQQNFDITDWPESWKEFFMMKAFRGGGQNMRIALEPGTVVSRYTLTFSDPYWHDKPIGYDFSLMSYSRWLESYDEKRASANVGFEHRKWGNWRKSINMRTENVTVEDLDYDAPQEIRDVKGDNLLFGVRLGTGQTKVDDIYLPTQGHVFRVGYEQMMGDFTFGVLNSSYVRYISLYEDILERHTVLATKIQGGTILGNAPPFEKFYGGGQGTYAIRGFDYRGVSTRGLQVFDNPAGSGTPQYKDPIGSDWILTASSEVTFPLIGENFSALTFLDSAMIDTGGLRSSIGAGIQIMIPQWFGPVPMRFEYGIPLQKDDEDDTRSFNFSMGRLF